MTTAPRSAYWLACLDLLAKRPPYVWGRKSEDGLDCSGFVTLALYKASKGLLDVRGTHNTDAMWMQWQRIDEAEALPGDLCLYWGAHSKSTDDVAHVMIFAGHGICFGQAWGGPEDVDPIKSRIAGKFTLVRPIRYRPDLAGFVRPPVV